ncbi:MAG: hypothetical protein KatS3mg001_471 [Candidatus Pacearchaeota archaeon]|nr:MAG: hypothetical protein KatS3mg001_471 [Candidatus Pacearchaeota archaeon]
MNFDDYYWIEKSILETLYEVIKVYQTHIQMLKQHYSSSLNETDIRDLEKISEDDYVLEFYFSLN